MTLRGAALLLLLLAACGPPKPAALTVSAAASVQKALQEIVQGYGERPVVFNFGASGMLAQQIEQGAPADIFLSAAPKPMDRLAARGLILGDTRRDLLRNRIVLIALPSRDRLASPSVGASKGAVRSFSDLPTAARIAIGEPSSVPAGDYAKQVLTALGLWDAVQGRLVLAKDVRQVVTYVENGDAGAGIVYATDAQESARVRVVETATEHTHQPVVYPIAVLRDSRDPAAARALVEYLAGSAARSIFERHGFKVP